MIIRIVFIILLVVSPAWGAFFSDGFESGDISHTEGANQWAALEAGPEDACEVVDTFSRTGDCSVRFRFGGNLSEADIAKAQLVWFIDNQTDFYVRYYIYFPSNYTIRDVSPYNNKFIVWALQIDYGTDMRGDMESSSVGTLHTFQYKSTIVWPGVLTCSGGNGFYTPADAATITTGMLGEWSCWEHHLKVEAAESPGMHQFWVNGVLIINNQDLEWAGGPCSPGYIDYGYFMGTANSGFDETTDIYIDDVVFSDAYIGPDDYEAPTSSTISDIGSGPNTITINPAGNCTFTIGE